MRIMGVWRWRMVRTAEDVGASRGASRIIGHPASAICGPGPVAQPPWMAGTSRISGAVASNSRIGVVWPGPSRRKARRPGVKFSAKARAASSRCLGGDVPLGQAEVAVAGLQQAKFGHGGSLHRCESGRRRTSGPTRAVLGRRSGLLVRIPRAGPGISE